jgi:hypothetical protein
VTKITGAIIIFTIAIKASPQRLHGRAIGRPKQAQNDAQQNADKNLKIKLRVKWLRRNAGHRWLKCHGVSPEDLLFLLANGVPHFCSGRKQAQHHSVVQCKKSNAMCIWFHGQISNGRNCLNHKSRPKSGSLGKRADGMKNNIMHCRRNFEAREETNQMTKAKFLLVTSMLIACTGIAPTYAACSDVVSTFKRNLATLEKLHQKATSLQAGKADNATFCRFLQTEALPRMLSALEEDKQFLACPSKIKNSASKIVVGLQSEIAQMTPPEVFICAAAKLE